MKGRARGAQPKVFGTFMDDNGHIVHVKQRAVGIALDATQRKLVENADVIARYEQVIAAHDAHWWTRLGRKFRIVRVK